MIYLGFVLAVVILFYAIYQKVKHEKWHGMYWDENRLHQETKSQLDDAYAELNDLTNKNELLEEALREKDNEAEVTGKFVQHRQLKRPTPETYRVVFDLDINGQRILEHLTPVSYTHLTLPTTPYV